MDAERLRAALNASPRTRIGSRFSGIDVLQRDAADRIVLAAVHGDREPVVRGEELRAVLVRAFGPGSVRSTRFAVSRSGRRFVFTGHGFGHGVGLCQAGAFARLRAGSRPAQVLELYYPGTRLVRFR